MKVVFTEHAKERIKKRKISEEEAIDAIEHPDSLSKKGKILCKKEYCSSKYRGGL